ncbi:MAG TPA: hypothetical protein VMP03_14925, partial [Methylomirabilota bacterium]|nr:hypothetical protein [Methylomirabilota bacterium]
MEAVQRDITRREVIRGCKDVIEAYFEAKLRIGLLADAVRRQADIDRQAEAAAIAASRFAAIGTFLANGQNEAARGRYTELSKEIERLVAAAGAGSIEDLSGAYGAADGLFKGMNQDCVGSARLDFI